MGRSVLLPQSPQCSPPAQDHVQRKRTCLLLLLLWQLPLAKPGCSGAEGLWSYPNPPLGQLGASVSREGKERESAAEHGGEGIE